MASDNTPPQQPDDNRTEDNAPNCQARIFADTGLLECLTKTIGCQWALNFGNMRFCKHPSKEQFVK